MSWSRRFDEPIILPNGKKLVTLKDAIAWLAKEIPKSEHGMKRVQAAEKNRPTMFARIGVMQALNRHHVREFNTDRKPHHWGKRKLKRDE
jgi:hypothetical protein